jgi:predicted transcriptional regulator
MLAVAIEREGNQAAFARRHGIDRANLYRVLKGSKPVSGTVLRIIGLRKVYAPQ